MGALEDRYVERNPQSRELFERHRSATPGGFAKGAYYFAPFPVAMERGDGCFLWDVDGHRYVDCANHHTALVLGHNHPAVAAAVQRQLERGGALGAPVGVETELCAELCRRVASLERVRFCNSGTEATLHAVRLARAFTGKPRIAKFEGCYHGSHDAVEISVSPPLDQAGPAAAPIPYAQALGMSPGALAEAVILPLHDAAAVRRLVRAHADELACVVFEPCAGVLELPAEFVREVRQVARDCGVPFIFDEIVAFRMAYGGAQQHYAIDPDLTAFGKIVGGGFPVGAFGGRAELMDLLDPARGQGSGQSGTYSAHPVTMAAGLATLRVLTPEAVAHLNALAERLVRGLNAMFGRRSFAAAAFNAGSAFGVCFTAGGAPRSYRAAAGTDQQLARRVFLSLLEQGYYLPARLTMASLSTPMQAAHVDGLTAAFEHAVVEAQGS